MSEDDHTKAYRDRYWDLDALADLRAWREAWEHDSCGVAVSDWPEHD